MTETEFADLRRMLKEACGIALDESKRYLIEGRLSPVIRRLGIADLSEFAKQLSLDPNGKLRSELVEALVTTESSFFRDLQTWETLASTVLPDLISKHTSDRQLTFWCAASASGQEPYSLAMMLRERFSEIVAKWSITILATDISRNVLERARAGKFSQIEVNRGLPASLLVKYFHQDGLNWVLRDDVRSMVKFQEMNLCGNWHGVPTCDLVFLRNVMIYFTAEDKKAILRKVAKVLDRRGFLLLGASETTLNLDSAFEWMSELKTGYYRLREEKR